MNDKTASIGEILEQAPRYAHLLDDVVLAGARVKSALEPSKPEASKTKQAALDQVLGGLYRTYGPTLQKHAAARFYSSLDKAQLTQEALGVPFCKLAQASRLDPWRMAAQVVHSYPGFVKAASEGPSVEQELSRFYVDWGDEMLKKANILTGAANLARKGVAAGGALVGQKGALRSAGHLAGQGLVKSEMPGAAKQVGQALKKQNVLQQMGGGSIARGQQLHAQNAAERAAKFGPTPVTPAPVKEMKPESQIGNYIKGIGVAGGLGIGGGAMLGAFDSPQPQYQQ